MGFTRLKSYLSPSISCSFSFLCHCPLQLDWKTGVFAEIKRENFQIANVSIPKLSVMQELDISEQNCEGRKIFKTYLVSSLPSNQLIEMVSYISTLSTLIPQSWVASSSTIWKWTFLNRNHLGIFQSHVDTKPQTSFEENSLCDNFWDFAYSLPWKEKAW